MYHCITVPISQPAEKAWEHSPYGPRNEKLKQMSSWHNNSNTTCDTQPSTPRSNTGGRGCYRRRHHHTALAASPATVQASVSCQSTWTCGCQSWDHNTGLLIHSFSHVTGGEARKAKKKWDVNSLSVVHPFKMKRVNDTWQPQRNRDMKRNFKFRVITTIKYYPLYLLFKIIKSEFWDIKMTFWEK